MPKPLRPAASLLAVAATIVAAGCGGRLQHAVGPTNQPPVVQLESTQLPTGDAQTAAARLRWTATDPDGRVDHFLVTEDPAAFGREGGWTVTTERERTLRFRRALPGAAAATATASPDFQFFAVKAVDGRGEVSLADYRAFFGDDIAPTVRITQPAPSRLIYPRVPTRVTIHWEGSDPDGPNGRPARYKYALFRQGANASWDAWQADPDSIRRQFAPTFAGWDSISGDSTRLQIRDLVPDSEYLFVITALDAEGAYDPVFSLDKNVLDMRVSYSLAPVLTFFNPLFSYTYSGGGFNTDPAYVIHIDAPASLPLTVNWYGTPSQAGDLAGYRWALDIADVYDETPRRNGTDLGHWSAWDLATTSVTLGPFHGPELSVPHRLYVEVRDENDIRSLGTVQFRLVRLTFNRDLLVMDDTRFRVDMRSIVQPPGRTDSLQAPIGAWPTAAELDTFLFAVGGMRWRMGPDGAMSTPGIFHGYRFDTLGTRTGLPGWLIPLDLLARYRHIVWITDGTGSFMTGTARSSSPYTALAYTSIRNRQCALAAWVEAGGRLWAVGGGFGNATNTSWNNQRNDVVGQRVYSTLGTGPDLVPGRFMYDLAHWRGEFRVCLLRAPRITKAPFASGDRGGIALAALLPATLRSKSAAGDPLPPYRTPNQLPLDEYLEYMSQPSTILEDKNPSPQHAAEVQALDTLMVVTHASLPAPGPDPAVDRIVNPVMTHYHGGECGPVTFSGFDCWAWARADCAQLVDAVLQGVWGLAREGSTVTPVARTPAAGLPAARTPATAKAGAAQPTRN